MELKFKLLIDYDKPTGIIRSGVVKTENEWMKVFPDLKKGDCGIKQDWFECVGIGNTVDAGERKCNLPKPLATVLIPISSIIEIYPNNKGLKSERVEDDGAEDGFYFKQVGYTLGKPNLSVNAKIECDNDFRTNYTYVSESGIIWIAVSKKTIINQSNIMDKFIFPKEVVCMGNSFTHGTGMPS